MDNSTPQQYSTVCPFIMVDDIEKQIDFLHLVFGAEVKGNLKNSEGISAWRSNNWHQCNNVGKK